MENLHATQRKLLELLQKNIDDPLTIRELQNRLDLSSPSLVAHHIQQLEKKGYLKRNPANPQDYQLLKDPEKPVARLNLYGMAQCGPNGSILDGAVLDRIPISTKLLNFKSAEAYLVKARGDSMEPLIKEGDLVIVQKTTISSDGKVVVCVNDGQALIKKIHYSNGGPLLESINNKYRPFVASIDDFRVEGEVKGIISPVF